jgi:hypothetical protein
LQLDLTKFKKPLDDFTFQIELDDKLENIDLQDYQSIEFEFENPTENLKELKCRVIATDYSVKEIKLDPKKGLSKVIIPLKEFTNGAFVLMPRPYPHFLPYEFHLQKVESTTPKKLNFIQFSIPTKGFDKNSEKIELRISDIRLEK